MATVSSSSRTPRPPPHEPPSPSDDDSDDNASQSSLDEDDVNRRMTPNWCAYRTIIEARGFRLDTCKDVKQWYQEYWALQASQGRAITKELPGYLRACRGQDENELCRDDGLPDRLFRGTQCATGSKVVIKAVHLYSREYDVIRYLSCSSMRNHPMNHCIPVLDLIELPRDQLVFVVMEEWAAHVASALPSSLRQFINVLRQCIEHIAFMHAHNIAHLDVSLRNFVTDGKGRCACIDYELSSRYDNIANPRVCGCRRTEVPPELERGESSDPFKVDVFALGMLVIKSMELTGHAVPELYPLAKQMISGRFEHRPTARQILFAFDAAVSVIHHVKTPSAAASHTSYHLL